MAKYYKVMHASESDAYACTFEEKSFLGTHEYCLYYKWLNNEIQITNVEVVEHGEWIDEDIEEFAKSHKVDLFWLHHFMQTHEYSESTTIF